MILRLDPNNLRSARATALEKYIMHGRLILPTATWLALLAPAARAQCPIYPGKSPPPVGVSPLLALHRSPK